MFPFSSNLSRVETAFVISLSIKNSYYNFEESLGLIIVKDSVIA